MSLLTSLAQTRTARYSQIITRNISPSTFRSSFKPVNQANSPLLKSNFSSQLFTRCKTTDKSVSEEKGKGKKSRVVFRTIDGFDAVKKEISTLCEGEKGTIKQEESESIHAELAVKYLKDAKLTIQEELQDGMIIISREDAKHRITVSVPPEIEANEEEDPFGGEDEEGEMMEGEEGEVEGEEEDFVEGEEDKEEQEDGENNGDIVVSRSGTGIPDEYWPEYHSFTLRIDFKHDGVEKGGWYFECESNAENLLDISTMHCYIGPAPNPESTRPIVFESLSEELKTKIRDYLQLLSLDDRLAHLVKHAYIANNQQEDVRFLDSLKNLMNL